MSLNQVSVKVGQNPRMKHENYTNLVVPSFQLKVFEQHNRFTF
jgi:hypothetical protein